MTNPTSLPLRTDLGQLAPYAAPPPESAVRLDSTASPWPPSPEMAAHLSEALARVAASLNDYPDPEVAALRADVADYVGLHVDAVWVANGANDVAQQVCQAFGGPGRLAMGFEPSYGVHRLIALRTGMRWTAVARRPAPDFSIALEETLTEVEREQPAIVFICTPNNPTGTVTDLETLAAIVDAAPGMVVVDEAYIEFARQPSAVALLPGRPRLIVIRSLSGAFGLAGARIGFLAADPAVVHGLTLVRLPYHVSALSQVAARVALAHREELLAAAAEIIRERDHMAASLVELPGVEVAPGGGNFLLVGGFPDASALCAALAAHGVLVRDVSNAAGLAGWLRVGVGTPQDNDTFLTALRQAL